MRHEFNHILSKKRQQHTNCFRGTEWTGVKRSASGDIELRGMADPSADVVLARVLILDSGEKIDPEEVVGMAYVASVQWEGKMRHVFAENRV